MSNGLCQSRGGDALALVARHPRLGKGKTRLARTLGELPTHALYCAFLRDLDQRLSGQTWQTCWLYTPEDAPFSAWLGSGRVVTPQVGTTFNERLLNGFRWLLSKYNRAIIMSTDTPHIPLAWIAEGFALLDTYDVVLGPCADGGYYLVGQREPRDLFSGIPMSTSTVLADTLTLARSRWLTVGILPETFDVDEPEDLETLQAWLERAESEVLPNTRAALEQFALLTRRSEAQDGEDKPWPTAAYR